MNKEQIYDNDIAPLMSQIITICKTHKIAMIADFAIGHEDDEDLTCTTALLGDNCNPPETMRRALTLLKPEKQTGMTMITVTKEDGSQDITAVLG